MPPLPSVSFTLFQVLSHTSFVTVVQSVEREGDSGRPQRPCSMSSPGSPVGMAGNIGLY